MLWIVIPILLQIIILAKKEMFVFHELQKTSEGKGWKDRSYLVTYFSLIIYTLKYQYSHLFMIFEIWLGFR